MGIALVIILIIFLCWPTISKWVGRWVSAFVARRTEDYIRRATGMPPRPGSREAKRRAKAQASGGYAGNQYDAHDPYGESPRGRYGSRRRNSTGSSSIIPKEYAEDVEFTETIEYSGSTISGETPHSEIKFRRESQVSDVEWEEIRTDNRKDHKR